jgi:hypothetical protein
MWTRRSLWVWISVRIHGFLLPLVMPLRIVWECIDAIEDLLMLTGGFFGHIHTKRVVRGMATALHSLTALGRFDLVDVEAVDRAKSVKLNIGLR